MHESRVRVRYIPIDFEVRQIYSLQQVSFEEGETLAKEYNIHFFETYAKQDVNVEKAFLTIATDVKNRLVMDGSGALPQGPTHRVRDADKKAPSGCCSK